MIESTIQEFNFLAKARNAVNLEFSCRTRMHASVQKVL